MNQKYVYLILVLLVAGYFLVLGHQFAVSVTGETLRDNEETIMEITVVSNFAGGFCTIQVTVSQSGNSQTQTDRVYVPPFGKAAVDFSFQTLYEAPVHYDVIWLSWQASGEVTGST
jgi:hypothetical protein